MIKILNYDSPGWVQHRLNQQLARILSMVSSTDKDFYFRYRLSSASVHLARYLPHRVLYRYEKKAIRLLKMIEEFSLQFTF